MGMVDCCTREIAGWSLDLRWVSTAGACLRFSGLEGGVVQTCCRSTVESCWVLVGNPVHPGGSGDEAAAESIVSGGQAGPRRWR